MSTFSKYDSLKVKGFAILCMIFYHLFAFPERIPSFATLPWMGIGITKSFQICVPIYLFIAGYGLQYTIMKKGISMSDCYNRLKKLYINYWWVILPFITIGISIHYYSFDIKELLLNILGLESTYNYEWWFYPLYVDLLIIFYLIIGRINIGLKQYTIFMIVLLICIGLIYILIPFNLSILWQCHLYRIMKNINIFILGCYFAKFNIFSYLNKGFTTPYIAPLLIIIPLIIRGYLPSKITIITDILFTPTIIIGTINLSSHLLSKLLEYMGQHSMNLWLIHSFFIYHYCKSITFINTSPIIMFLVVIICSLGCSLIIDFIKQNSLKIF